MPYTRTWDDGTPAGTRAASQIDDAIREFKVDLHERMDSTLVVDWTADPVVARAEISGPDTKKRLIHGSKFVVGGSGTGMYDNDGSSFVASQPGTFADLDLAPNSTITRIRWLVTNGSAILLSCFFRSMEFAAGHAFTTLDTRTTSAAGADQILDSTTISIAIDDTHAYYLAADISGGGAQAFTIHAVEITYTIPSAKGLL